LKAQESEKLRQHYADVPQVKKQQSPPIMEKVVNATEKLENDTSQGLSILLKYGGKEIVIELATR
jgi:hypothetical protein